MINIKRLKKMFYLNGKPIEILKGININIDKGEFISIRGTSGSGKTTLLNIIGLLDSYNSGEYHFLDNDVKELSPNNKARIRRKELGYIFQNFNLISDMTAIENVEMTLGIDGVNKQERRRKSEELLEMVKLKSKQNNLPSQLSGGEKQRIAIARALSNNPKLLIADEPTGNLDRENSLNIMRLLADLNEKGVGIILVTHDDNIAQYAKKHYILEDGYIRDVGINN